MHTETKIAVAGATGRVGRHVVDVLEGRGYEVVSMSRSNGVDIITGAALAEALHGVDCVIDTATGHSADEVEAKEFFTTAARNLQGAGDQAGVRRIVVVSIIGCDRFSGGYNAAKVAHEQATMSGPVPARVLRAAQFHEFVEQLVEWGRLGDVSYVPEMRTQLVAARTVAVGARGPRNGFEPRPRHLDPGDRRPAGGKPRRGGASTCRSPRRRASDRSLEQPIRSGP